MFHRVFFISFLLFSNDLFATDFYWWSPKYGPSVQFGSAFAVCSRLQSELGSGTWVTSVSTTRISDTEYRCIGTGSGMTTVLASVSRQGDSCPPGTEYDSATTQCKSTQDHCDPTKDQLISHRHKLGDLSNDGSGKLVNPQSPPNFLCQSSCKYSNPTNVGDCYRFTSGDPSGAFCNYSYKGTGVTCTAGETDKTSDQPDNNVPESLDDVRCTEKVIRPDGTQVYVCIEASKFTDPGSMNCGQVNGETKCIPKTPDPVTESKEVVTEVAEKPLPDGGKEISTTTTTTVNQCRSVGACTTIESVTNKTTVINGDGSSGGSTSTCTGAGCKDADGKTQGDRDKAAADAKEAQEKEEAKEGKVEGGTSCDAPPSCSGDAIQCATLQQQYKTRCDNEKARDFSAAKGDIETLLAGSQFKPSEEVSIDVPGIIGKGSRFLSGSCPAAMSTSVMGKAVAIKFDPVCTAAESLAPLILIMSALGALLVVVRSSS